MSRLSEFPAVAPVELFKTSTSLSEGSEVGQRFYSSDGREFVLVQNGGTALVAGYLVAGPPSTSTHQGLTVTKFTAASVNGNQPAQVTVTLGATNDVCTNEYQGGFLFVATGTGIGQMLKIASHPKALATASCVITLEDSPAVSPVAGASTVSLIRNPYGSANGGSIATPNYSTNGVVVNPTTQAGEIVGACLYAIPASTASTVSYGLLQTRGYLAMINDANTAIGIDLMPSSNTAGALMTYVVGTCCRVGYAAETGTTTRGCLTCIQL